MIAIPQVHQSLLIRLRNTPTKIVTGTDDCEYSRILVSSIASAHEYNCEYLNVHLQVLMSVLKFSARKFSIRVWAHHSRALAHTRIWHSRVILRAIRVTRTHTCIQKIFRGGMKKVCSRLFKMQLVGLVETETFFSDTLSMDFALLS